MEQPDNIERLCPYIGLRPFHEEESLFFKGRDEHVDQVMKLMENDRFLMLTGASGDGKSSLLYAGVIPNLRSGFVKAKFNNWAIADFKPERSPLVNFAKALDRQFRSDSYEHILSNLTLGFSSLCDLYKNSALYYEPESDYFKNASVEKQREIKQKASNLLIIVDQFEEFFTNPENCRNGIPSTETQVLINLLQETVARSLHDSLPVYFICTIRADFLGNCTLFKGLPDLIRRNHYFIPRLNRSELKQVIQEPCTLGGFQITDRLVERLIYDLNDEVELLPVLQHALYQIWHLASKEGSELDLIHYAMAGGITGEELPAEDKEKFFKWFSSQPVEIKKLFEKPGLSKVLDNHVTHIYYSGWELANKWIEEYNAKNFKEDSNFDPLRIFTKVESYEIFKKAFCCLTKLEEGKAIRNRMTLKEITETIGLQASDYLRVAALLSVFREEGNNFLQPFVKGKDLRWIPASEKDSFYEPHTVLDITHEALIRNWSLLKKWAQNDELNRRILHDFETQLFRWLFYHKDKEYLLGVGSLDYFQTWYNANNLSPKWLNRFTSLKTNTQQEYLNGKAQWISVNENESEPTLTVSYYHEFDLFFSSSRKQVNKRKNQIRVALGLITTLALFLLVSLFITYQKKNESDIARQISKSNEIANRSFLELQKDPTLAFRLAEDAYTIYPGKYSNQALLAAYAHPPFYSLMFKHNDPVTCLDISPDSNTILSGTRNGQIYLWDIKKDSLLFMINGHNERIRMCLFSPDGEFFVTVSDDFTGKIWDKKGRKISTLSGHKNDVWQVEISANSKNILTASKDGTARLWATDGVQLENFKGHSGAVSGAWFLPDEAGVITISDDKTIKIWNWSTQGHSVKTLTGHKNKVRNLAFSPVNNKYFVTCSYDGTAILWDTDGNKISQFAGHSQHVVNINFSHDGKKIITSSDDKTACVWNLNGEMLFRLTGHTAGINKSVFTENDEYILTAGEDKELILWNKEGSRIYNFKGHSGEISGFSFITPDIVATSSADKTIRVWNIKEKKRYVLNDHQHEVLYGEFSKSGNYFLTSSWDKSAILYNQSGHQLVALKGHDARVLFARFFPGEKKVLTISHDNSGIIWDINGKFIHKFNLSGLKIVAPEFVSSNKNFIIPYDNDKLALWDSSGNNIKTVQKHSSIINDISFSEEGNIMASAGSDNQIRIWNQDGKHLFEIGIHTAPVKHIQLAKNGSFVVTASKDSTAKIIKLKTTRKVMVLRHKTPLEWVELSHNENFIATFGHDNLIYIWSISGKLLSVCQGHTKPIRTIRFAPSDTLLLSASEDGSARLWKVPSYINRSNSQELPTNFNESEVSIFEISGGIMTSAEFSPDGKNILTTSTTGISQIWPLNAESVLNSINQNHTRGKVWKMGEEELRNYGVKE